jgi:hypothetical protein
LQIANSLIMSDGKSSGELIIQLLQEKALLKKDVYKITSDVFTELKQTLKGIQTDINNNLGTLKKDVDLSYRESGDFEAEFNIADDTLVFILHSNVFTFDRNHRIWKLSYVKDNPDNAFCGKIYVYNFLADSFRFNRMQDTGYLIARIFVNREKHFFVEGKRQLGFLYNNFESDILDSNHLRSIIESTILYSLDFELFSPPYEQVQQLTVEDIVSASKNRVNIATGKRLGFRFQADNDSV